MRALLCYGYETKSVKKGKHLSCSANLVMVTGTVRCQSLHLGGKIMSAFLFHAVERLLRLRQKARDISHNLMLRLMAFECWGREMGRNIFYFLVSKFNLCNG